MKPVADHIKRNWKRYLIAGLAAYGAAHGVDPAVTSSLADKVISVIGALAGGS